MAEGANKWPGVGWVVTIPCSNHNLEGHMKGFNYYPETSYTSRSLTMLLWVSLPMDTPTESAQQKLPLQNTYRESHRWGNTSRSFFLPHPTKEGSILFQLNSREN